MLRNAEDNSSYTVAAEPLFVTPEQIVTAISDQTNMVPSPQTSSEAPVLPTTLMLAMNGTIDQKKQFIGALLLDSQTKCSKFLNRLTVAQNGVNVTGDVLTTILSGVATAVAPISVSHGFSAASTIVSGTKTALNQDFWAKAGAQDFQKALATSYYATLKSYTNTIEMQSDLNLPIEIEKVQSIHNLCTVGSAMNTISTTLSSGSQSANSGSSPSAAQVRGDAAGTAASTSTTNVAIPGLSIQSYVTESQIRRSSFAPPTQTTDLVQHWLWPTFVSLSSSGNPLDVSGHLATPDSNHVTALRKWLSKNPVKGQVVPIFVFVNNPALADLRARAITEIPITVGAH